MVGVRSRLRALPRRMRPAVLAMLLAATPALQAQVPVYPIPMAPAAFAPLLVPLILVIAAEQGGLFSMRDARIAAQSNQWPAVLAIANKELRRQAATRDGEAPARANAPAMSEHERTWRLLRAYAQQRMGRYAMAAEDYRLVLAERDPADAGVELNYGICLMVLARWGEAQHLMLRLAEREPKRWEPQYNLGVIRSITGDEVGAQIALERLRALNADMANTLESQYLRERPDSGAAPAPAPAAPAIGAAPDPLLQLPALTSTDLSAVSAPGRLPESTLVIGQKLIRLPAGRWALASRREYSAPATMAGWLPAQSSDPRAGREQFPALSGTAFALEAGTLRAIVSVATNVEAPYGSFFFDPPPCDARDAFIDQRLGYGEEPGTCAYARWFATPDESHRDEVRGAAALAQRLGAVVPRGWYELHLAQYGSGVLVSLTVVWPAVWMAGNLVAADWLTSLPGTTIGLIRR